jgi:hypothetical protein
LYNAVSLRAVRTVATDGPRIKGQGVLPADGKLAAAKMEFNMRISARPYWQLEKEYTLTFMSAMPGAAGDERGAASHARTEALATLPPA